MMFSVKAAVMPTSFMPFVSGVQRVLNNVLKNVGSFSSTALVMFDHNADLYVVELKVANAAQQVIATKVDMKLFIGVRTLSYQ